MQSALGGCKVGVCNLPVNSRDNPNNLLDTIIFLEYNFRIECHVLPKVLHPFPVASPLVITHLVNGYSKLSRLEDPSLTPPPPLPDLAGPILPLMDSSKNSAMSSVSVDVMHFAKMNS